MLLLASKPHQVPGNEKSQITHEKLSHQDIILSHRTSVIETMIQNTLISIPTSYTNHFNKEHIMKSVEPKILNYKNLYWQHSQATEESKGRNSCTPNQSSKTATEVFHETHACVTFCQDLLQ
jgi:hypothetical protein